MDDSINLKLLHKRIPRIPTDIKTRAPGPRISSKDSSILDELISIFEPLNLTLLQTKNPGNSIPQPQTQNSLQILNSLLKIDPDSPTLLLKLQSALQNHASASSPQNLHQMPKRGKEVKPNLETLAQICDSVDALEGSLKLKKKRWMYKPRNGVTVKQKIKNDIRSRENQRSGSNLNQNGERIHPKGQKSRYRVLTLKRKVKILPGMIFKSKKTKQKFVFTTAQRTIHESELSLLTAAYALHFGSRLQNTAEEISLPDCQSEDCKGNMSLRDFARGSTLGSGGTGICSCKKPQIPAGEEDKGESVVCVNQYDENVKRDLDFVEIGVMDHTLQLLAYGRELTRRIGLLKSDGIAVDGVSRPVLKFYEKKPMSKIPVPTSILQKSSLANALGQAVASILAHAGFTQASLSSIEVLSEVVGSFYENFCSNLKNVVEKEAVGLSHGFLDPFDRVIREYGLSIDCILDYYTRDVIGYHNMVESWVDRLENKYSTLIGLKVCNAPISGNQRGTVDGVAAGAYLRNWRCTLFGNGQGFQVMNERDSLINSRHNSTETDLNLQIDSVPSISSI